MTLFQPGRKCAQRLDGIALVVENHVGRIEVHAGIRPIEFGEKAPQRFAGFLASLKRQLDPFLAKNVRDHAQPLDEFAKSRILLVLWEKPRMERDRKSTRLNSS